MEKENFVQQSFEGGDWGEVKEEFWENGNLRHQIPYLDGEIHGVAFDYYENGVKDREAFYVYGDLKKVNIYCEEGNLKLEIPFKGDKIHGTLKEYYGSGVCVEIPYNEGKRTMEIA